MNPPNNPLSSSSSATTASSSSSTGQPPLQQQPTVPPQASYATVMTPEKIQKLREKVEALKTTLTDEGKRIADRIVDQFQRGAFDSNKLSMYVKELKAKFSLSSQQQQPPVVPPPLQSIPPQQPIPQQLSMGVPTFGTGESMLGLMMSNPSTLVNQQPPPPQRLQGVMQPPQQPILHSTSANVSPNAQQSTTGAIPTNVIMASFTEEERQLMKQIKEMTAEERKEYVKRNPAVMEVLTVSGLLKR